MIAWLGLTPPAPTPDPGAPGAGPRGDPEGLLPAGLPAGVNPPPLGIIEKGKALV